MLPHLRKIKFDITLWSLLAAVLALSPAGVAADVPVTNTIVPLTIRRDLLYLPARVNGTQDLSFLLDTGFEMTMLHPKHIEAWALTPSGRVTIVGIAGRERASTYRGVKFQFGEMTFSPREVAGLASDSRLRRDGVLGSEFFRRFVVEIDLADRKVTLHQPNGYSYSGKGEIIPLRFIKATPIVHAVFASKGHEPVAARLEIDTGCDGALCLGNDFIEAHSWLRKGDSAATGARQGVGGGAAIALGTVPSLQLGNITIEKPKANFFVDGSPTAEGRAGHLGMEILKKFRMIFDYRHNRLILEPR